VNVAVTVVSVAVTVVVVVEVCLATEAEWFSDSWLSWLDSIRWLLLYRKMKQRQWIKYQIQLRMIEQN